MLYYLTAKDGSIFYLLPNRSYTVGRKECDLVVKDQAVSRKHAVITVNRNDVSITDCGSTYGTFVGDVKLKINEATNVPDNTVIKFGVMASIFKMTHVSIQTTTSGIGGEVKATLKKNIYTIGGSLVNSWTEQCTHLTVEEILLTVKVLSSVISGTPIVTTQYWEDYLDAIKNNRPIPNISYYTPKCNEVLLNGNVSFEYKEERKRLFKNKIFLFALKSDKAKMDSLIKLAGGDSISWEENPLPKERIEEEILKNYVIIQPSDSGNVAIIDASLLTFIKKYTETGKRTIQLQELALAIVGCSCEKECNPNFNRQAAVFKISSSQSQKPKNEKILAMPTQSLEFDCWAAPKTELIIPETCELTTKIEVVDESPVKMEDIIDSKPLEMISTSWNSKRNIELDHDLTSVKKPKFEDVLSPVSSNSSVGTFLKSIESRSEQQSEAAPGKSLFAFKYEKIASTTTNYINPFATKRKAQEDIMNQPKKPTFLNSTVTSSQTTNNSNIVVNPFSNILRSKRRKIGEKDVKFTSTQVHENTTMGANSLEINFSAISAVDPVLEKSFRWIPKGDKSNVSLLNEKQDETMDKELLMFINSFKNSVIVEEDKDLIVRRPNLTNITNQSLNVSNIRNFKTFRKVQPLRIQTTIIPESSYVSIVCNQRSE